MTEDPAPEPQAPRDWDALRAALPEPCRATLLKNLDLPTHVRTYTAKRGLRTLGELAELSQAELLAARQMGRLSVRRVFVKVSQFLARGGVRLLVIEAPRPEAPQPEAPQPEPDPAWLEAERARVDARRRLAGLGLLASWKTLLLELPPPLPAVLALRAGLEGSAQTLRAIGQGIGRSRERVRQFESRAIERLWREPEWLAEVRTRVDAALQRGAVPVTALAADPWWAGIAALPHAIDYFGARLLGGRMRVVELSGEPYLAPFSQEAFEDAWSELRQRAEVAPFPVPLATLHALVDPFRERLGAQPARVLWERLLGLLHLEATEEQPLVTGMGTQASVMLALLSASPVPLHQNELRARVGRGPIPDEVLRFGKRMLGLEHHIPDFAGWTARLVPPVIRMMDRDAPERQWHVRELHDELGQEQRLPDWLSEWHLVALLRRSGKVRYLGRGRFVLVGAPEGESRIRYRDELFQILCRSGKPMSVKELMADLTRKTGVGESTTALSLLGPPFVHCGKARIGLRDRDVPGGAKALAEAAEHVAAVLTRRRRGLAPAQIDAEVTHLSPAHALWTPEMCLSGLHGDPRFRFSKSDVVGLSSWESVRVPSRVALLRRCLEDAGGRVHLAKVERKIAACYGERPSRVRIMALANQVGAIVRGRFIEWEADGA